MRKIQSYRLPKNSATGRHRRHRNPASGRPGYLIEPPGPQAWALGNGELADTDEAVHLAGILIAEQSGGLAQAHGQVAVGPLAIQVYLILEGAGHRPQGEALLGLVVVANQCIQVSYDISSDKTRK